MSSPQAALPEVGRNTRWVRAGVMAAFAATTAAAAVVTLLALWLCLCSGPPRWLSRLMPAVLIVVVPLAVLAVITIHELGHALAGYLFGWRFQELQVVRLRVRRTDNGLRLQWAREQSVGQFGWSRSSPPDGRLVGWKLAVYAGAGTAANLIAALACLCSAWIAGQGSAAACLLSVVAIVCAVTALPNLVPRRLRSGVLSDGARILDNLAPAPAVQVALRFEQEYAQGRRPKDWGLTADQCLEAASKTPTYRDELWIAAVSLLVESGEWDRAMEVIRLAQAHPSKDAHGFQMDFELEGLLVEALRGDTRAAISHLQRIAPQLRNDCFEHLAEAALNVVEGRYADGRVALNAWCQAIAERADGRRVRVGYEWAEEALRVRLGEKAEVPSPCPTSGSLRTPSAPFVFKVPAS